MSRSQAYKVQNSAIHTARAQLERMGLLDPWNGLEQIRDMAGELNLGIRSISRLSLDQRRALIDKLNEMGAQVKNPFIYDSDRKADGARSGKKQSGKIILYSRVTEDQLRMLDILASRIQWHTPDGYLRFCYKLIKCARPLNSRQVTTVRLALASLVDQQAGVAPDQVGMGAKKDA